MQVQRMKFHGASVLAFRDAASPENPTEKRFKAIEDTLKSISDQINSPTLAEILKNKAAKEAEYERRNEGIHEREAEELRGRTGDKEESEEFDFLNTEGEDESEVRARQESDRYTSDAATRTAKFLAASARRWGSPAPVTLDGLSPLERFAAGSRRRWNRRSR